MNALSKMILAIFGMAAILMMVSCKECSTEPEDSHYAITLSVKETAPKYIRLYFLISDSGTVRQYQVKKDSIVYAYGNLIGKDTVITFSRLTPSTEYNFKLLVLENDEVVDSSETVSATTPAAPGHNFTFDIQTLGDYGSRLWDVFIVDENNIWVVGNIETDSGEYNAAQWNGTEWELTGIYSNTLDLHSIWYFSENDIWVLASYPIHWDGEQWTQYHLTNMGIIPGGLSGEMWGTSSQNMFFVGRYGRIIHYDGSAFTKMESGTGINLTDVWGYIDDETGEEYVWAGGNKTSDGTTIVLSLQDGQWQTLFESYADNTCNLKGDPSLPAHCESLWAFPTTEKLWIAGGNGVFVLDDKHSPTRYDVWQIEVFAGYFAYPLKIRGNNPYDVFVAGESRSLFHYNGVNWHWYSELTQDGYCFLSMDVKGDLICAVGEDYTAFQTKALIVTGHRE